MRYPPPENIKALLHLMFTELGIKWEDWLDNADYETIKPIYHQALRAFTAKSIHG